MIFCVSKHLHSAVINVFAVEEIINLLHIKDGNLCYLTSHYTPYTYKVIHRFIATTNHFAATLDLIIIMKGLSE